MNGNWSSHLRSLPEKAEGTVQRYCTVKAQSSLKIGESGDFWKEVKRKDVREKESKEIGRNTRKLTIIGARVKKTAN